MPPARLLIADDHAVVRQGIRALLQEERGWQVVAEANDGREAVVKAAELKPDLAILDIMMPSLNGLDATKQITKLGMRTKVLILSTYDSDNLIRQIIEGGARGYILKADAGQDLIMAVSALLENKTFFTAKVAQIVMDGYLGNGPKATSREEGLSELTGRQREITQLLAEGHSIKNVSTILGITTRTAETHRTNLMRKLDCHSVTELVRYAVRNQLMEA